MKIKIKRLLGVSIPALLGILLFIPAFFSCKKDDPTKAIITVLDTNGVPVVGATVAVFDTTSVQQQYGTKAKIFDWKISDGSGKTEHTFKWEAFLFVSAIRADSSDTAVGYVRLEYQKTVESTVQFHP